MTSKYRENGATPRQRDYSAFRCGFAMELPDFTTTLTVTQSGRVLAQTTDLERSEVRDELHRLRGLYLLSEGYDITATVKERTA